MVSAKGRSILRHKILAFRESCIVGLESMGLDSSRLPDVKLEERGLAVSRNEIYAAADGSTTRSAARENLKDTAKKTLELLPQLLTPIGKMDDAQFSHKYTFDDRLDLSSRQGPAIPTLVKISVMNRDALNVAMDLIYTIKVNDLSASHKLPRPLVVNFANAKKPGGGWLNGRIAQEEAICFRSSLSLSLHKEDYPLKMNEALYNPYVMVMRDDHESGHNPPAPSTLPEDLPIVSAVTIAALEHPAVKNSNKEGKRFVRNADRETTKQKMRLTLRIAAGNGHRMLVLGAFGCGVFKNPPDDIAQCWLEVLSEVEFKGKWWDDVCFAVYDPNGEGNFEIFRDILDGQEV